MATGELLENLYIPTQVKIVCDDLLKKYDELLANKRSKYSINYENGKAVIGELKNALTVLLDNHASEGELFFAPLKDRNTISIASDKMKDAVVAIGFTPNMYIEPKQTGVSMRKSLFRFIIEILGMSAGFSECDVPIIVIGDGGKKITDAKDPELRCFEKSTLSKISEIIHHYDEKEEKEEFGEAIEALRRFLDALDGLEATAASGEL